MEMLAPARPVARPVPVDVSLVDTHLPGWDYADAWAVVGAAPEDALTAVRSLFDPTLRGRWIIALRDLLVRPLRLRPASSPEGAFPVLHQSPELVVVGMDDRHLDFRVLVDVRPGRVRCTTAVRRRRLGRAYFLVVVPFHRRVVPSMLERAVRRGWTGRG